MSNNAGTETFQFPVLPEKIQVTSDAQNDTVNVAGVGEITIIQSPGPRVFEWSGHFPANKHQGCIDNPLKPQKYVGYIEKWKESGKPPKFVITGSENGIGVSEGRAQINTFCSIESFSYYEQGGDPDTLYYTITLKEYREVAIRKLDKTPTTPASGGGSEGSDSSYQNGTVNVKKSSRLKLYKSKSTSSKVLAKMPNKAKLKVYSKSGSWYKVTYVSKKKDGYAQAKYVKISK